MTDTRVEVDGRNCQVTFQGECLDLLPVCRATCCRVDWTIAVTAAEHASGALATQRTCRLTKRACEEDVAECVHLMFELTKDAEKACVHLGDDDRCTVYVDRPKVCREFRCQGGWRLNSVAPAIQVDVASPAPLDRDAFVERLSDEMTFVSHPLVKLQGVFYVKARDEVSFLKKMVGACGVFYTRESFRYPELDDDVLLELIRMFESKDTLGEVYQRFSEVHPGRLTRTRFDEIVWVLNKHSIVLEARNFEGMLGGVGGI